MSAARRRLRVAALVVATIAGVAPAGAHDPTAPPIVEIAVRPEPDRVVIAIRVPAGALADANLPSDTDGRLPATGLDAPLVLVGRAMSQALEVRVGETRLAEPEVRAVVAADRASAELQLTYVRPPDGQPLSARLQQARVGASRIRTLVRYEAGADEVRTFELTGDYERVVFEPAAGPVSRDFAARGFQALLAASIYWLVAGALVATPRTPGALGAIFAAFIAGQSASLLVSGLGGWAFSPSTLATARAATASAVVVLAAFGVLAPGSPWIAAVAAIAGVAFGADVAGQFWSVSAFAGARTAAALTAFIVTLSLGQAWILALLSAATGLFVRWRVPERWGTVAVAVVVSHAALHEIAGASQALAESGDRLLILLAAGWAIAILGAAIVNTLSRGNHAPAPPRSWAHAGGQAGRP